MKATGDAAPHSPRLTDHRALSLEIKHLKQRVQFAITATREALASEAAERSRLEQENSSLSAALAEASTERAKFFAQLKELERIAGSAQKPGPGGQKPDGSTARPDGAPRASGAPRLTSGGSRRQSANRRPSTEWAPGEEAAEAGSLGEGGDGAAHHVAQYIREVEAALQRAERECAQATSRAQAAEAARRDAESELADARAPAASRSQAGEQRAAAAEAEAEALRARAADLEARLAAAERQREEMRRERDQAVFERERAGAALAEMESNGRLEREIVRDQVASLEHKIQRLETDAADRARLAARARQLEEEVEALRGAAGDGAEQAERTAAMVAQAQAAIAALEEENADLKRHLRDLRKAAPADGGLAAALSQAQQRVAELEGEVERANAGGGEEEQAEQAAQTAAVVAQAQAAIAALEEESSELKRQLRDLRKQRKGEQPALSVEPSKRTLEYTNVAAAVVEDATREALSSE